MLKAHDSFGFLGNGLPAHRSVMTAIACFTTSPDSFEGAMVKAIAQGDDTDTLAGAISGAHLGLEAVPERWRDRLETGPKGAAYIESLAETLHALYLGSDGRVEPA